MKAHLLSFARGPVGYILNLLATAMVAWNISRIPGMGWLDLRLTDACELLCLRDGIQDDWHPLF